MGVLTGSWKRVCELAIIGSCKNVSRLMISLIRLVVSVASIAVILSGCTFTIGGDPVEKEVATDTGTATEAESVAKEPAAEELTSSQDETKPIQAGTAKPELDYSSESPGCKVAAQRIADNIQVGMTLADVRRLVGKPRTVIPGSWTWTRSLSFGDSVPGVKYGIISTGSDAEITSFTSDSSGC